MLLLFGLLYVNVEALNEGNYIRRIYFLFIWLFDNDRWMKNQMKQQKKTITKSSFSLYLYNKERIVHGIE